MAAELPQYKSSEQIKPAPIANVAEPYNRLSAMLDTYSTKRMAERQQIANMQASEQGEEAGYNLNYQPATGGSQTDMYYNKAARKANRLAVGADIGANISRIQSGIINNPSFNPQTASQEFSSAVQGYSDGLLSNIPKGNRAYAQNMLKYHAAQGGTAIADRVAAATKAGVFVDAVMASDQFHTKATNAAFNGDLPAAMTLFGQSKQALLIGVQNGSISPNYAAAQIKQQQDDIIMNNHLGHFNRMVQEGKTGEAIKWLNENPPSDLDPQEAQTLRIKANGILNTKQQTDNLTNVSLDTEWKDNISRVATGQPVDPQTEQRIATLYPDKYPGYLLEKKQAQKDFETKKALYVASPDQVQDLLQRITPDPKAPGYHAGLAHRNEIEKIAAQQKSLRDTDPGGYTINANNTMYPAILERYQTTKDFNQYNSDVLAAQSSMGVQPEKQRVMSNAKAADLVGKIKSLDYDTGLNQLKQLQTSYGKYMPIAMKSLTAQGLPKTYNMLLGMQDIPKSAPAVPDAVQAFSLAEGKVPGGKGNELETLFKNSGKDAQSLSSSVQKSIQPWLDSTNAYSAMSGESQAEYIAGVTNLAKFYASKGDSEKDAAKKAYDALIGNKYSAIEGTYRVPQGISPDVVRFTLNEKDKELSTFNFQDLRTANPYLSKQYLDERNFKDAITKGHWVSMPDDSGWARVDVNGLPVKDKQGNIFKVTNQDLFSPAIQQKIERQGTSEIAQRYDFGDKK